MQGLKYTLLLLIASLSTSILFGQPAYKRKPLVQSWDSTEFKSQTKDSIRTSYLETRITLFDVDDNNTTLIQGTVPALVMVQGPFINNERNGVFNFYLIDSLDHSKCYKIYEQTFAHNKLNGRWNTFNLRGTLVKFETFKDDSLDGLARSYWIDGQRIMDETVYYNGTNHFLFRFFSDEGKLQKEVTFKDGKLNGPAIKYYEPGKPQEEVNFKNEEFDGVRKYYYPNGRLWIEEMYKNGKHWTVIANYTADGKKRNPGTLKNGNGTLILYDEDGSVRETQTFKNGEEIK